MREGVPGAEREGERMGNISHLIYVVSSLFINLKEGV